MPRFVILRHETPPGYERPSHWDLMLEFGSVLKTWALAEEPVVGSTQTVEPLDDHRLEYLNYEGPVSGGRGTVSRWDDGTYELIDHSHARLVGDLRGQIVRARLTFERISDDDKHARLTIVALD